MLHILLGVLIFIPIALNARHIFIVQIYEPLDAHFSLFCKINLSLLPFEYDLHYTR